jgi:uncharacterized protein (TIGR02466 family)
MSQLPSRVVGLFATPVMHTPGAIDRGSVERLRARLLGEAETANRQSSRLLHTVLMDPRHDDAIAHLNEQVLPLLQTFGELLFGERLPWLVKELWGNVLLAGGQQAMHNHANSLVSGIVYLSPVPEASRTTFVRALGHPGYVFSNQHAGVSTGPFNADKWVMPEVQPGDVVLFPSHLLHEVPPHDGSTRVTLAFNAVPRRLDAWGYTVSMSP